ncbi:MAG: type II secretion system protein N [Candidatus Thiodiazotropha sp.]
MNNWKYSFNAMTLLLLLAIAAMSVYIYYRWSTPSSYMPSMLDQTLKAESSKASETNLETLRFVPIPLKAYVEITDRPLFVEGRLPLAEPQQKSVNHAPRKPLRLKLEGVAMMPDNKVAIIRDLDNNELLRLSQGMNKYDWKVESVDSQSAIITRKGERIELKLDMEASGVKRNKPPIKRLPFRPSNR